MRRQVYANAGFVALSAGSWSGLLERWWDVCDALPEDRLFSGEIDDNPLWAGDQDVLNALLMSEVPEEATDVLPEGVVVFPPDLERIAVLDLARLTCELDGGPVSMLHYSWVPKPWQPRAWRRMRQPLRDAYARLLPRVLFGDDVPIRLDRKAVPAWLRGGVSGAAGRGGTAVARPLRRLGARAVRRLPAPARNRILAARDRRLPPHLRRGQAS